MNNDWIKQIVKDKNEIDWNVTDDEAEQMSKTSFKKVLKQKVTKTALKYLNEVAATHSKSRRLMKDKLKCEEYILDRRFSSDEVKTLFRWRTSTNLSKSNFRQQYEPDLICDMCRLQPCTPEHQFSCIVMKKFVPELETTDVIYDNIFGSTNQQLAAVKLLMKIERQREKIMDALRK